MNGFLLNIFIYNIFFRDDYCIREQLEKNVSFNFFQDSAQFSPVGQQMHWPNSTKILK